MQTYRERLIAFWEDFPVDEEMKKALKDGAAAQSEEECREMIERLESALDSAEKAVEMIRRAEQEQKVD